MPQPSWAHSSSWTSDSSPFSRVSGTSRQCSKLFLRPQQLDPTSISNLVSFMRVSTSRGNRQCSKRFRPQHSWLYRPCFTSAELSPTIAVPLLFDESVAAFPASWAVSSSPEAIFSHAMELSSDFCQGTELLLLSESTIPSPVAITSPASTPTFSLPHSSIFLPLNHPPSCPNSDPHINMAPADTSSLPCVSSTLRRDAWAFFLQDYPDRIFVDAILHIIDCSCDIGFLGDWNICQLCSNLSSAVLHPEAIVSDINLQLSCGRISGPFDMPPLPNFRSSPLGIATRKHCNKLRRIHHLSWPHGSSVNDGIPDSEASITYDMFQTAVSDLISSGRDSLMIKLDLEQAFRHIPVHPFDWPLLGFTWLGAFFYERFLTFGA